MNRFWVQDEWFTSLARFGAYTIADPAGGFSELTVVDDYGDLQPISEHRRNDWMVSEWPMSRGSVIVNYIEIY